MTVRLITIPEVEVGMITLENNGRAQVTRTWSVYRGFGYEACYIEGKFRGEPCSHEAIPEVTVWIEELQS